MLTVVVFSCLTACSNMPSNQSGYKYSYNEDTTRFNADFGSRLPEQMDTSGKKLVLVDPKVHAWGAYDADGKLVRAGMATAGGSTCPPDADEADCRTGQGTFHITSLGGEDCASKTYPRPKGGGLMPYCMFFNNGQALHGSPDPIVVEDNVSHGCVRMRIQDAEWMRYNFAQVGMKVVVEPYD
jgi:lipoprotein-anchoring transpeptidase ErfK/SrfK